MMERRPVALPLARGRRWLTMVLIALAFALAASAMAVEHCEVGYSVEAVDVHSVDGVAVWRFRDLDDPLGGGFWATCDCDLARGGAYRITCNLPWSDREVLDCRR